MIWAYMGPAGEMPELPALEMALVPASHRYVTKKWQDCNWVQALEGSIDTAHFTFAHLSFEKEENEILDIKKHFVNPLTRVATDHMRWIAEDPRPVIKINPHEAGLTVAGGRLTGSDNIYWRIAQFLMPVHAYAPSSMPGENIFGQSFIPVTDTNCWIYTYAWNPERPLTQAERDGYDRGNGVMSVVDENYIPLRNKANDYLIDRKLQKTNSYTGIKGVSEQDAAVQDSQGPIADRTREHLGPTDLGIMHFRKLVMDAARALQQGEAPPHLAHQDRYAVRSGACVTTRQGSARGDGRAFRRRGRLVGGPGGTPRRSKRRSLARHCERSEAPYLGARPRRSIARLVADDDAYNGIVRYSRLPRLASSRSRSRSIRRLVSSVILPSRSSAWMNLRSAAISSRVSSVPAAETSCASGSSESGSWLARVSCRARSSLTTSSESSRSSVMASSDFSAASSASRRAAISASCSATCSSRPAWATPSQRTTGGSPSPSPTSVMKMTPKETNRIRSR